MSHRTSASRPATDPPYKNLGFFRDDNGEKVGIKLEIFGYKLSDILLAGCVLFVSYHNFTCTFKQIDIFILAGKVPDHHLK